MARFRLKAGQHIARDPDWVPTEEDKEMAKAAGRPLRARSRTYHVGDEVESDTDLVQKHGAEKFERLTDRGRRPVRQKGIGASSTPGDVTPFMAETNPSVAPHGQVQTGFQQAGGHTTSAPISQPSGHLPAGEEEDLTVPPDVDEEEDEDYDEAEAEEEPPPHPEPVATTRRGRPLPDNLDRMTIQDMRNFAAEEEIDLKGATRREDILRAIRAAKS